MIIGALVSVKSSHLDGVNLEFIYFEAQSYVLKTMLSLGLREITRGSSQRWYQSHTDCRLEIALALVLASLFESKYFEVIKLISESLSRDIFYSSSILVSFLTLSLF